MGELERYGVYGERADNSPSFMGQVRKRLASWIAGESSADTLLRELEERRRLFDARVEVVTAELRARLEVAQLQAQVEEAESHLALRRELRAAPDQRMRQIMARQLEEEVLLLELDRIRRQRLERTPPPAAPPSPAPAAPAIATATSDQEMERVALKAVNAASQVPPENQAAWWQEWRRQLERRFPPMAAGEIANRAEEIKGMMR